MCAGTATPAHDHHYLKLGRPARYVISGVRGRLVEPGRRCHDHRQWTRPASSRIVKRKDDGGIMTDRTYRVTEIVGTSAEGVEPAISNALRRAAQTLRHLDWFEVTQIRGQIQDGQVAHYQVGLKVGFRLEDA